MKKPTKADALIAKAQASRELELPPADALAELKKLADHNDSVSGNRRRVSAEAAIELLASYGYICSRGKLDSVCRAAFGRRTYGNK